MLFLIESRFRDVVSVSTYDIPFVLRHMTSYMTCFWSNLDGSTPNLVQWSIESHIGHKTKYVVSGAITLMLWLCYGCFMAPL